jgi:hypothetical protein
MNTDELEDGAKNGDSPLSSRGVEKRSCFRGAWRAPWDRVGSPHFSRIVQAGCNTLSSRLRTFA